MVAFQRLSLQNVSAGRFLLGASFSLRSVEKGLNCSFSHTKGKIPKVRSDVICFNPNHWRCRYQAITSFRQCLYSTKSSDWSVRLSGESCNFGMRTILHRKSTRGPTEKSSKGRQWEKKNRHKQKTSKRERTRSITMKPVFTSLIDDNQFLGLLKILHQS